MVSGALFLIITWRPVKVMDFAGFDEACSCGFWSEVALRRSEQFVANHELSDGGGTQERREIVGGEMPSFMGVPLGRRLGGAHGIKESRFKPIIVTNGGAP